MKVRTRFAPSPTGYLHVGGARTALYSWLHARSHAGEFVLRIEDTDLERSSQESVQGILDGMAWLGLGWDEGPYYQTARMDRYREVMQQLLDGAQAYHCYCSKEALEEMREGQRLRGEKPRYDGRCRSRLEAVAGVSPVIRFRSPDAGVTVVEVVSCEGMHQAYRTAPVALSAAAGEFLLLQRLLPLSLNTLTTSTIRADCWFRLSAAAAASSTSAAFCWVT